MTADCSFAALGGTATVVVTGAGVLDRAVAAVRLTVEEFDRACSRFRPDSDLSALNRAAGSAVRVPPVLLEAVEVALQAAELTDGLVDPTIGAALVALGYDRDRAELQELGPGGGPGPDKPPPASRPIVARSVPGWQTVRVDPRTGTVRLPAGAQLDLGATAKALAADRAAERAAAATGAGVLVSLSGDMALCGPPPAEGWLVRVTDDHRSGAEAPGQTLTVWEGGLATSSTRACRWRSAQGPAHHLVDPVSGAPVNEVWATASVAAQSCVQANIASTAAIVGADPAAGWLRAAGLPARLIDGAGVALHLGGWPAQGEELPVHGSAAVPA